MLRAAAGVLIFALALSVATAAQARYASIVIDYDTGRVLHESNADTRNYPASLAKMMTLYLAFEALERGDITLDKKLKVSRRAAGMPAAKLGLKRGETITVKNAILALITKSANDAAVVVAEALGEKETRFARMMTRKAKALGMKRTQFRNASGLPNRRQLSTARDMATLARALIRDFPKYYRLFATKEFVYKGKRYRNHNRLLRKYAGADGIKTGYIRASGFNLAASVSRNGRRLIAVVFGGKTPRSRDRHIAKLLDRGFAKLASTGPDKIPAPPPRKPSFALAGDFMPSAGIAPVTPPATPKRPAARKAAPVVAPVMAPVVAPVAAPVASTLAPGSAPWRPLPGVVRHGFTHFRLELEVWTAPALGAAPGDAGDAVPGAMGRWFRPEELDAAALPTLMRKVARHALAAG